MESIKIKLHSMTDLITNSSTVIYTYSDASKEACEKMIDAIFETFGIDKKCSDVFTLKVETEDISQYLNSPHSDDVPKDMLTESKYGQYFNSEKLSELRDSVSRGEVEQPQWLTDEIEHAEDSRDCPLETTLVITPKEEKYAKLAELIRKFLYSTDHEATRDG